MTPTLSKLRRQRVAVRAFLAFSLLVSLAVNVLDAKPDPGVSRTVAQLIFAWPPLALMLCVEMISRVPADSRWTSWGRRLVTVALAGIAGWISYWHMVTVVKGHGESSYASQYLWPLTVDGLAVVASLCLVEIGGRIAAWREPQPVSHNPAVTDTKHAPVSHNPAVTDTDDDDTQPVSFGPVVDTFLTAAARRSLIDTRRVDTDDVDTGPVDTGMLGEIDSIVDSDPWQEAVPVDTVDPDTELTRWTSTPKGRQQVDTARVKVASSRKRPATYDVDTARKFIRDELSRIDPELSDAEAGSRRRLIDAAVRERFGVSDTTARNLRRAVSGGPVSGPPAVSKDVQGREVDTDGDRD